MIKRIFLLIFLSLFSVLKTEAFLGEDLGIDLYYQIDEGSYKLKETQLEYELKGGKEINNLAENLNKQLESNGQKGCFKSIINIEKLKDIVLNNNLQTLYNVLEDSCKVNNTINSSLIGEYYTFLKNFYQQNENKVLNKSKQIYKISKIGLYIDGNTDNSPFDLIKDLQEINSIIFGEEIDYPGIESYDLLKKIEKDPNTSPSENNKTGGSNDNDKNNTGNGGNNSNSNNDNDNNFTNNNSNNNENITNNNDIIINENECNNINQTGLNEKEITNLKQELIEQGYINTTTNSNTQIYTTNNNTKTSNSNNITNNNSYTSSSSSNIYEAPIPPSIPSNYNIENDNSQWQCNNNFFCTTVDFIMYEHKLLGYGKTKSIMDLIKVSNGHLRKAANTSLAQAKMSVNNFENILKDINFVDSFHIGIILTQKTPPFLKLEKEEDNDFKGEEEPLYKKLLKKIYKNQGLDYNRKNDLLIISKYDENLKDIINIAENGTKILDRKKEDQKYFTKKLKLENEVFNNNKSDLLNDEILNDFYKQLIEYKKLILMLENYANNILPYVKKLYEIPRGD